MLEEIVWLTFGGVKKDIQASFVLPVTPKSFESRVMYETQPHPCVFNTKNWIISLVTRDLDLKNDNLTLTIESHDLQGSTTPCHLQHLEEADDAVYQAFAIQAARLA
jgi:hypothetical protein